MIESSSWTLAALVAVGIAAGCGAGRYGFAREYTPLDAEEPYLEKASAFTFEAVVSDPADFRDDLIGWFGVVEKVEPADDGRWKVRMAHRKHQRRHLCEDETSSSCRVTVHFKSSGGFTALLDLRPEDVRPGLDKVQPGTLIKVYGKVRCRENDDEEIVCDYDDRGGVLLDGVWYRQWPARYYVTTRAAATMRR
ncbi:MAG: hypothetical protein R6V85_15840 [Polyangia bacterium]